MGGGVVRGMVAGAAGTTASDFSGMLRYLVYGAVTWAVLAALDR